MKRIATFFLSLMFIFSALTIMPTSISAAAFVPRTTDPGVTGLYYNTGNPFPLKGRNCTWYAFGRAYELLGSRPNLNTGNAKYWYLNDGGYPNGNDNYARGSQPRLGAIACWNSGNTGHVAVVERIEGNDVYVSESSSGDYGYNFRNDQTVADHTGNFQGYIYIGDWTNAPPSTPTISTPSTNFQTTDAITINWTMAANASQYQYYLAQEPAGYAYETNIRNGTTTQNFITFNNLPAGNYIMFVHAVNAVGSSPQSNWVSFIVDDVDYLPTKTVSYDGHLYSLYDYSLNWAYAVQLSRLLGGHLAVVSSKEENEALTELIASGKKDGYWLGGGNSDIGSPTWNDYGTPWKWINGETFGYSNWAPNEPNGAGVNASKEHFILLRKSSMWSDEKTAGTGTHGFILEIDDNIQPVATEKFMANDYVLFDKSMTWKDAKAYCESIGGHLVTITSDAERAAVERLLDKGGKYWYWTGATDEAAKGAFQWVTGESFVDGASYIKWMAPGNPTNIHVNGRYVMMYQGNKNFTALRNYYNYRNDMQLFGFICEFENSPKTYTITTAATLGGTVTGGGTYTEGETITLTATPEQNYIFDGWYENNVKIAGAGATYSFPATTDRNLEARFTYVPKTFEITATASNGGIVAGGGIYTENETVTLTATANTDYIFDGWYENGAKITGAGEEYSFPATSNRVLEARFVYVPKTYTITAMASEGGTVNGSGAYTEGETVTIVAMPEQNYVFDGWYENGAKITGATEEYSFPATSNRVLEARFIYVPKTYTITITATMGGSVTGGGAYTENEIVTLKALPAAGFNFDGWYEGDEKIGGAGAEYSFAAEADRTLEARFVKIVPVITTEADALDTGIVGFPYSVTITATNDPTSFKISAGNLPDGLSIDDDGVISGVPTSAGKSTFSVTATNAGGESAAVDFSIEVTDALSFTDGEGNIISALSSETLVAMFKYQNKSDRIEKLTMIVAVYSPEGRLVYIGSDDQVIEVSQIGEFEVRLDMPENIDGKFENGYSASVFLWDSETFVPVIEEYVFQ